MTTPYDWKDFFTGAVSTTFLFTLIERKRDKKKLREIKV
jgi:hypothetical protein